MALLCFTVLEFFLLGSTTVAVCRNDCASAEVRPYWSHQPSRDGWGHGAREGRWQVGAREERVPHSFVVW